MNISQSEFRSLACGGEGLDDRDVHQMWKDNDVHGLCQVRQHAFLHGREGNIILKDEAVWAMLEERAREAWGEVVEKITMDPDGALAQRATLMFAASKATCFNIEALTPDERKRLYKELDISVSDPRYDPSATSVTWDPRLFTGLPFTHGTLNISTVVAGERSVELLNPHMDVGDYEFSFSIVDIESDFLSEGGQLAFDVLTEAELKVVMESSNCFYQKLGHSLGNPARLGVGYLSPNSTVAIDLRGRLHWVTPGTCNSNLPDGVTCGVRDSMILPFHEATAALLRRHSTRPQVHM